MSTYAKSRLLISNYVYIYTHYDYVIKYKG